MWRQFKTKTTTHLFSGLPPSESGLLRPGRLSQKPVLYPSRKSLSKKKGFTAIYTEPDKNDDMSELLSLMPLLVFKVRGKIQGNSFPLVLLLPLDLHSQVEQ